MSRITLATLKQHDQGLSFAFPIGDDDLGSLQVEDLTGVSSLKKNSIVFIKNKKFLNKLLAQKCEKSQNLGIIFAENFWQELSKSAVWEDLSSQISFALTTSDINMSMARLSQVFYDEKIRDLNNIVDGRQMGTCEIHPTAWIAQNVFLGENVKIAANVNISPGAVIMGEVEIGENTIIYPNVTIYPWVVLGKDCRIHSGSVLGTDGFGYHFHKESGQHLKIWHLGGVMIHDNVEIGANCSIDMGTFNPTIIGAGCKLDNQVHIGHNNTLGVGVILCGKVGTAGSVSIGDFTVLGGEASIAPDLSIGEQCQIAGGAKVVNDLPAKSKVGGHPARPLNEWLRGLAYIRKHSLKKN